jgi:hypothetical protein
MYFRHGILNLDWCSREIETDNIPILNQAPIDFVLLLCGPSSPAWEGKYELVSEPQNIVYARISEDKN